jgi:LuxR family maltose regulon positive regulatory protein
MPLQVGAMSKSHLRVPTPLLRPGHETLLTSKLRPPRPRGPRIDRPRLLQILSHGHDDTVTLVVAPAGYGKTTLLGQWSVLREHPVAWLSLAPSENDPNAFLAYLVAAIRAADAALISDSIANGMTAAQLVTTLLNALAAAERPLTIVLDDYHVIDAPETHEIVRTLIEYAPDGVRLLLSSRSDPPLPLARLRVRGQLTVVSVDDLRFTLAETEAFYAGLGMALEADDLVALHEQAAGWIAGLQMAAISLGERPAEAGTFVQRFGGTTRLLQDFLLEEVLAQQPAAVQNFLLKTALFERFSADLYRAITGDAQAAALLERAVRANLFISALDERGEWYHYHHLFHEFLRQRAASDFDDAERREAYTRASAWFEQHSLISDAIAAAIAGQHWPRAADLIRPIANGAVMREDVIPLVAWFRLLPVDVLDGDPSLSDFRVWAAVRTGDPVEAEEAIAQAERAAQAANDVYSLARISFARAVRARYELNPEKALQAIERGAALLAQVGPDVAQTGSTRADSEFRARQHQIVLSGSNVQRAAVLRMLGRAGEAEHAAREARAYAQAHDTPYQAATAGIELGNALVQQGRLGEAMDILRAAIEAETTYPSERRLVMVQLADIARERGQLAEARNWIAAAHDSIRVTGARTWLPQLLLGQASVAWASGDTADALLHAQAAEAATAGFASERLARAARAFVTRVHLAQGDVGAALKWAHDSRLAPDDDPDYARLPEHLVYARLLTAQGDPEDAVALLERLVARAEADGRQRDIIACLVLIALAQQDQFELDAAVAALDRALELGTAGGFLGMFVEEGQPLARLLKVAQRRGVATAISQQVLEALGAGETAPAKIYHQELVEPITARELDVLRLIAVGLSNKEIGDELFISVSTVKRHITNLYGKLGTSTRTEALQKARQLGLLARPADGTLPSDIATFVPRRK